MPVLEIVKYGNSTLTKKAKPVENISQEVVDLVEDMIQTMHAVPGLGLAAPQVNISKRIIVVDLSVGEKKEDLIILINPELLSQEGEVIIEEGCLSVPGFQEKVVRPLRVVVKGLDLEGKEKIIEAEDLLARVFCHELDHLNGKLFIERLSPLKRALIKRKLSKEIQTGKI